MSTATAKPIPAPLYVGATTCDFVPAWVDTGEVLELVRVCFDADPDELTPQLMLADSLAERGDQREKWVRAGVRMWREAGELEPGKRLWDYGKCKAVMGPVCETVPGWRLAGLWGCLVAWHCPAGDGTGRVMGRTWSDDRVKIVQRCLWFWSLGFLNENPLDDAAGRQADVWKFSRSLWERICKPLLKELS